MSPNLFLGENDTVDNLRNNFGFQYCCCYYYERFYFLYLL